MMASRRPSSPRKEQWAAALRVDELSFHDRGPYSFTVEAGQCVGLHGASGAGKTLLLRAMVDLDPHQGTVWLGDTRQEEIPAPRWRRRVGLLPAESFWWYDLVGEHFSRPPASEQLVRLGFGPEVLGWRISRLSTGEKQRLAFLRLLANRPEALLLDEPTASLDAANIKRVEQLVLEYMQSRQVPVLWVSHDPEQLQRVADWRLFMDGDSVLHREA
ncbi:ABC transporter ATP-binding protein [Desulfolithobacter dissulfuricans]|nr:ABC transporter ATP-binding protein [Desulfolithobacter dissulfuricans]